MKIVLTGSVAFDYLMSFPGHFREHILPDKLDTISLSFLVETMTVQRGGIAPNIAYTLALLGGQPRVMATVGQDFGEYGAWLESKGVDISLVRTIPGVFTASFFANTDRANNQIASFYPGAMAHAASLSFYDLAEKPDLVMVSPNDPAAMVQAVHECRQLGIPYIYDPSQQLVRIDSETLRDGMHGAFALFVNEYEYSLVQKMTGLDQAGIMQEVALLVVTLGKDGVQLVTREQELHVPAAPVARMADPTGVGDAFRGGFLAGFSRGWNLELCAQMGVLAASYCLENLGPQGHAYTPAEYVARFRQTFDDHGQLDALLA